MTMRARTFVVPAGGMPYRAPDPLPAFTCPVSVTDRPPVPNDILTAPTGDTLLPQVLLNAPRGAAWQSDELAPPIGTTNQHRVWAVVADALASFYGTLTRAAFSAFPSVGDTAAIEAFEADYGLPDPCQGALPSLAARRQAIRQVLAAPETASRQDLVCLAQAAGFETAIDEWECLEFGFCGFGEEGFGHPDLAHLFFVNLAGRDLTWITFGQDGFGEEGFGSFLADPLICLMERARQAHTRAIYLIDGAVM